MKSLAVLTTLAIGGGVTYNVANGGPDATVTKIVDGDTIEANVDGTNKRIRLLNIDTPEMGKECLAQEAKDYLASRLPIGTEITLEYDEDRTDKYGRDLAAIFVDDSFINKDVVAAGFATAMKVGKNTKYYYEIKSVEAIQQGQRNGIFGVPDECLIPDQQAASKWQAANEAILALEGLDLNDPSNIGKANAYFDVIAAAIQALKTAKNNRSEFHRAVYPDVITQEIGKLQEKLDAAKKKIRQTEREEQERKKEESEREAERQRIEKEQNEFVERVAELERLRPENGQAVPAPSPNPAPAVPVPDPNPVAELAPAPAAPAVDSYTGCRAYGGNYALTSIDDKGRAYAKIDCNTKVQIG
ncbi:thermonuclease family protein [Corynebacterium sp. ZY180755]